MSDNKAPLFECLRDITAGLANWRVWGFLAWTDIRLRYRRTLIGPFWMTISTGIMIGAMGLVWGLLFKADLRDFFPYLAAGLVTWLMISALITESSNSFIAYRELYKDLKLPLSYAPFRAVTVQGIVFAHNVLIFFVVAIAFGQNPFTPVLPLALVGLLFILLNGAWLSIALGLITARFRDLQQLVNAFVTIIFLVTPIFWQEKLLGQHSYIAKINPITHFIDLVRQPLLGEVPSFLAYSYVAAVTLCGWGVALAILARGRQRLPFWL